MKYGFPMNAAALTDVYHKPTEITKEQVYQ